MPPNKQRDRGFRQKSISTCTWHKFYSKMRTCTDLAKEDATTTCLSFDFEQNLPLPYIPTSDIFYLQQLWVYVFGVHNCATNLVSMYVWPESLAYRGSNEVVSCLHQCL